MNTCELTRQCRAPAPPANRGSQYVPAAGVQAAREWERTALITIRRQTACRPRLAALASANEAPAEKYYSPRRGVARSHQSIVSPSAPSHRCRPPPPMPPRMRRFPKRLMCPAFDARRRPTERGPARQVGGSRTRTDRGSGCTAIPQRLATAAKDSGRGSTGQDTSPAGPNTAAAFAAGPVVNRV